MHPIDDPFGTPGNGGGGGATPDNGASDRTLIMPRPGGRAAEPGQAPAGAPRPPQGQGFAPAASGPMLTGKGRGLNPMEQAAGPLLALLTRLRGTIAHAAPASLRAQLLGHLRQFEEQARQAGIPQDEVMLARYVLCTALDEAVLSTPWGSASEWSKQSLLITLHNEAWGGEKSFQLLDHCLQNPRQRLNLLELLYLCMCLGFEGRYRVMHDGRHQLEALRERTAGVIRSVRGEREQGVQRRLSPEAMAMVRAYPWPGNVRQLENILKRLIVTASESEISKAELEVALGSAQSPIATRGGAIEGEKLSASVARHLQRYFDLHAGQLPPAGVYDRILHEIEVPLIEIALDATGGNQAKCADLLGINRNTLRKKLTDYGIGPAGGR